METVGNVVIYIIMAFVVIGVIAAIRDDESGTGKEFKEGLHAIGPIYGLVGASPAVAGTTFIAVDMGGYQLTAGIIAMLLAVWIAVPKALELEREDRDAGIIAPDEYLTVGGPGAGERANADNPDEDLEKTSR